MKGKIEKVTDPIYPDEVFSQASLNKNKVEYLKNKYESKCEEVFRVLDLDKEQIHKLAE